MPCSPERLIRALLQIDKLDQRRHRQQASIAGVDPELVAAIDEHLNHVGGGWWQALLGGLPLSGQQYLAHLVRVVLGISRTGGVIVGRGAHLILGPERAFRVRVVGSLQYCAGRIAEREGVGLAEAEARVLAVDRERDDFISSHFGAQVDTASSYDLVLNSDRFSQARMVDMILRGLELAGYELPVPDGGEAVCEA